jgi:hypothetical protein
MVAARRLSQASTWAVLLGALNLVIFWFAVSAGPRTEDQWEVTIGAAVQGIGFWVLAYALKRRSRVAAVLLLMWVLGELASAFFIYPEHATGGRFLFVNGATLFFAVRAVQAAFRYHALPPPPPPPVPSPEPTPQTFPGGMLRTEATDPQVPGNRSRPA